MPDDLIADFTRSIPPYLPIVRQHVAETFGALALDQSFAWTLRDGVAGGTDRDRAAGATWLSVRFGETIAPDRVIVTNGTQGGLLLLLEQFVGNDGLLLAECLSYTPIDTLARRAHVRIEGLAIDDEGIVPEAFEAACKAGRPRALYCNPTVHNPTTSIMPQARRLRIAEIARRHGVVIIEDDPLGRLHPDAPRPIAALAPDICWYVMGATKCLAHGLRIAYLVAPSASAAEAFLHPVRGLSHWYPAPFSVAVATRWIETGAADEIVNAIHTELVARQELAVHLLRHGEASCPRGAMHLWLRLPPTRDRHDAARILADRGVRVRPSDLFAVDARAAPNAVRLSLSSPLHRDQVENGLLQVAALL